ncbi:MAG: MFS transporter, partial [Thermoguttaceae bacterium]|nr:MFS transporter [Thermoguttaceae bacterium]
MAEGSNFTMYPRLQLAYAAEFAIWGSWSYKLGGWGGETGVSVGTLYTAFALGALFSPLVGPIADKKFAAQKVFAFMQLLCGAALLACHFLCGMENVTAGMLWAPMFIAGIAFMPSIPLLNAIVFKHVPDKAKCPWIFIFGTIGWILVNYVVTTSQFFLVGGGVAIALALYALTLPNTPPSGSKNEDPFGFKALSLFKRPDFFVFMLCAFMVGIFGSNYYFGFVDTCFPDKGVYNQYSEIIFMAALSFAVPKLGLKKVLAIGMGAWGVRYLCFASMNDHLALIGLLCHGGAYAFLYTAAYMYADKVAPEEMKASVQALVAFLLLGVAQALSGVSIDYIGGKAKLTPAAAEPAAVTTEESTEAAFFALTAPAYAQDASIDEVAADDEDVAIDEVVLADEDDAAPAAVAAPAEEAAPA